MSEFNPDYLNKIKSDVRNLFPMPRDFALAKTDMAKEILNKMKIEKLSFADLPATDLNYAYQMAALCEPKDFASLKHCFKMRMTQMLYDIGFIYCQWHIGDEAAVSLFMLACDWMQENKQADFKNSLFGQIKYEWKGIFEQTANKLKSDDIGINEFCRKYKIDIDTLFYKNFLLFYLADGTKTELIEHGSTIADLISFADVKNLRPLLRNYVENLPLAEMPDEINNAIFQRLQAEGGNETLGLTQNVLQEIRSLRYIIILKNLIDEKSDKLKFYISMISSIRQVEILAENYFSIDFGKYIIIDNTAWQEHSYAYTSQIFKKLLENWQSTTQNDNYWPAFSQSEIATAREIVLGLKRTNVIKLGFKDFDKLYAKDVLSIARFT